MESLIKRNKLKYSGLANCKSNYCDRSIKVAEHGMPFMAENFGGENYNFSDSEYLGMCRSAIFEQSVAFLVSGLMSMFTNPAKQWLGFTVGNVKDLSEDLSQWLENWRDLTLDIFRDGSFYDVLPLVYRDAVAFDAGCMIIVPDIEGVSRFQHIDAGSYSFTVDVRGDVDYFCREAMMTAQNIVDLFGDKNISHDIEQALEKDSSAEFKIFHVIEKNVGEHRNNPPWRDKSFRSYYYDPSDKDNNLLNSVGYDTQRAVILTWSKGYDVFGRGIGSKCLPLLMDLNDSKEKLASVRADLAYPALLVDSSLAASNPPMRSNTKTFVNGMDSNNSFFGAKTISEVNPNSIAVLNEDIAGIIDDIRSLCHVDAFLTLMQNQKSVKTATEVDSINEERMIALNDPLNNINSMQNDVVSILMEDTVNAGLIPPSPDGDIENIDVTYMSSLHQASRSDEVEAQIKFIDIVGHHAQLIPEAVDKVNISSSIDNIARLMNIDVATWRNDDEFNEIQESRQQEAQAQKSLETAGAAADVAGKLNSIDMSGGTGLDAVIQGVTGE